MINNLFSIFDPTSTQFNLRLNWVRILLTLRLLQYKIWLISTRFTKISISVYKYLNKEITQILTPNSPTILFIRIILTIFINNFIGLIPYIFTRTRHFIITISISFLFWISFNIYGWIKKSYIIFRHLVPIGTPTILIPFIVIIETIRNTIRPITLRIRLIANITAGHLLISLISSSCESLRILLRFSVILLQMLLILLELAVAIIQAYVFRTLISLYFNEIN